MKIILLKQSLPSCPSGRDRIHPEDVNVQGEKISLLNEARRIRRPQLLTAFKNEEHYETGSAFFTAGPPGPQRVGIGTKNSNKQQGYSCSICLQAQKYRAKDNATSHSESSHLKQKF